jgi:phage shock protein A
MEQTMGIMTRVIRIFKADVHGVMDQLEDQELLLKQHLRDMAEALNLKEAKLNKMCLSRQQMQHELDQYRRRAEALERDLAVAIHKNKDDIARMLIRKIKPLENLRDEIAVHIRTLDKNISHHKGLLDQQRLRYEQLKHRSIAFFQKTQVNEMRHDLSDEMPDRMRGELAEEEIELELLKRKEALGTYS